MAFNKKTVATVRQHVARAREAMAERADGGTDRGPTFAFGARFVRDPRLEPSHDAALALMGALNRWLTPLTARCRRVSVEAVAALVARGELPGAVPIGDGILFRRVELRARLGLPAVSTSAEIVEASGPVSSRPPPRAKNDRRPRTLTRPARKVSGQVAAQAARVLKERGFT